MVLKKKSKPTTPPLPSLSSLPPALEIPTKRSQESVDTSALKLRRDLTTVFATLTKEQRKREVRHWFEAMHQDNQVQYAFKTNEERTREGILLLDGLAKELEQVEDFRIKHKRHCLPVDRNRR